MAPTLVVLAAGLASRYGGPKQLVPVGPGGETLMEYAIHDALAAGFDRIVVVVRPETEAAFRERLDPHAGAQVPIAYVHQRVDALPDGIEPPLGRSKPWGTVHALIAARDAVRAPFAVINADDFYGASAFAALADFLATTPGGIAEYATVPYPLRETLSEAGGVNRALTHHSTEGWLESIEEVRGIERAGAGGRAVDGGGRPRTIPGDAPVSMNIWGFTPAVFQQLAEAFRRFLAEHGRETTSELLVSEFINDLVRRGIGRVRMLHGGERWCGLTHADDAEGVRAAVATLVASGVYPPTLWGSTAGEKGNGNSGHG